MQKTTAGTVGLYPLAVEDELGDGALADVLFDFIGGAGGGLDVDFGEGDVVGGEEALRLAAVAAPGGRVDKQGHGSILAFSSVRRVLAMYTSHK